MSSSPWLVLLSKPIALAECKDEVHELLQDINKRNTYTAESRAEAKKELAKAEAAILKPECRGSVQSPAGATKRCSSARIPLWKEPRVTARFEMNIHQT